MVDLVNEVPRAPTGQGEKWGGLPIYLAVLLQGVPLSGDFSRQRTGLARDMQQELVERVTTVGVTESIIPTLVWGTIYVCSLYWATRKYSLYRSRMMAVCQWPLLALVIFSLASGLWSPNIGKVLASSFHTAGVIAIALAAAIRCSRDFPSFIRAIAICFAANMSMHLIYVAAVPGLAIAADGRWMGMSSHSNTLGSISLMSIWASVVSLLVVERKKRAALYIPIAISFIALYGSASATSIIVTITTVVSAITLKLSWGWSRSLKVLANVVMLFSIAVGIFVIAIFGSILNSVLSGMGKSSDFTGRNEIWGEAWKLVTEHPILGWGFDDNARVIVETGFMHTSYHNGFLDLAVRGGLLATILMCFAIFIFLRGLTKARRDWRVVCIPMLIAFLMHNMMEVSTFSPRSVIWLVMVTLMFSTVLASRPGRLSGGIRQRESAELDQSMAPLYWG